MKEWWLNLSLSEKQTVGLGSVGVLILLIYALIWSPLANKVSSMREQIQHNTELLTWMQAADKQLQALEHSQKMTSHSSESLLSVVQTEINQSSLATQLTQLRQAESDSVQLSFKQVDFDKLISWLAESCRSKGIVVSQITVTPSESPGVVSAELILKSS